MTILGPNGLPVRSQQQATVTPEMLIMALQNHEQRLAALGAQQIHLGIMVEYLTDRLGEALEGFEIDQEEFVQFRDRRWKEMQEEAKAAVKAQNRVMKAATEAVNDPAPPDENFDLDFDDLEDPE